MITVDVKSQILLLIYSFAVGAFLSAFYDIFRTVRIIRTKNPQTLVFFEDIFFWLITCGVYTVFIFAANRGVQRLYLSVSALCGFFMWRITVGNLFLKLLTALYKTVLNLLKILLYPIIKILDIVYKIISNILVKTTISMKKLKKLFIFEIKGYIICLGIRTDRCFCQK